MRKIGNLLCKLTICCVIFGANFILQKFCPCKINDKYKVCLIVVQNFFSRHNALKIWHKLHKHHPNPPKWMYFQSELLLIASARDRWPMDWTIVLRQTELFKVFICFSSYPLISPGVWCKSTPHTNTFVWPCGHQRRVISLILEDDLMCLRDSPPPLQRKPR